jgi:hypothetical protein
MNQQTQRSLPLSYHSRSNPKPLKTSIAFAKTHDPKAINSHPWHRRRIINFNSDRSLTANSLTPLPQGGIGDDGGFYGCGGILVLGIDLP